MHSALQHWASSRMCLKDIQFKMCCLYIIDSTNRRSAWQPTQQRLKGLGRADQKRDLDMAEKVSSLPLCTIDDFLWLVCEANASHSASIRYAGYSTNKFFFQKCCFLFQLFQKVWKTQLPIFSKSVIPIRELFKDYNKVLAFYKISMRHLEVAAQVRLHFLSGNCVTWNNRKKRWISTTPFCQWLLSSSFHQNDRNMYGCQFLVTDYLEK